MKLTVLVILGLALIGCSPSEDARAREQAHQTAEQAKHDAKEAAQKVKTESEKASQELDKDLHTAREKVRGALDANGRPSNDKSQSDEKSRPDDKSHR
ncbi:MAG TPA: hypothetical protein VKB79_00975 [Bryobacteraceae bacterium]|nr:hypothetical protein [Bryobacteraceae bacterium]